jgi:hypothetical protein
MLRPPGALTPRQLMTLTAGRAAFRMINQLAPIVLIPVWTAARFDDYTNAIGVSIWALCLASGVEKAILKLLPRTRRITGPLAGLAVLISAIPAVVAFAVLIVTMLAAPGSAAELYLAAAVWTLTQGPLWVVAALHRLDHRPLADPIIFGGSAAAVAAVVALTWDRHLSPVSMLLLFSAAAAAIACAAGAALAPAWWPRLEIGPHLGRVWRIALTTTWTMGLSELFGGLPKAVGFALLAVYGQRSEAGAFYIAGVICTAFAALLSYLFRLAQPATSVRQRSGGGAASGRALALVWLGRGAWFGATLVPVMIVAGVAHVSDGVLLVVATGYEIVVFAAVSFGAYLLENIDSRSVRLTASSSGIALVACTAVAAALIPDFGSAGALAAMAFASGIQGMVLRRMVQRRYPVTYAEPARPVAAPAPHPGSA